MTRDHNPQAPFSQILVGAYALGSLPFELAVNDQLEQWGAGGLEIPFRDIDPAAYAEQINEGTPQDWSFMATMIPRVMQSLANNPHYGLASNDEASRQQAVNDVRRIYDVARNLQSLAGFPRIVAIEVHSSPGPKLGSMASLEASLKELIQDLPLGITLVLEHCDAASDEYEPAKGFFDLSQELALLEKLHEDHPLVLLGVGINWGRSAIEGRGADTPLTHAREAARTGLPVVAVLSGASASDGDWGPAWADTHIPPSGNQAVPGGISESLLTKDEIAAFVEAAEPTILALKISNKLDESKETSLRIVQAALSDVQNAIR